MQLLLVRCEDCPDIKQWISDKKHLSSDIINKIIKIMSKYHLRELLGKIRWLIPVVIRTLRMKAVFVAFCNAIAESA